MQIITISREFGSGGRELGKRIADLLQFAYYDKEIVAAVAEHNKMDEAYVSGIVEKGLSRNFPITVGRTFAYSAYLQEHSTKILVDQQRMVKELAERGNCVVMGQGADIILQEYHPLNLFVYADMPSKIDRCRQRGAEGESFAEGELKKKIRQVDAGRSRRHGLLTNRKWGARESYHLCVNTTGIPIKLLAPQIADYAAFWFAMEES